MLCEIRSDVLRDRIINFDQGLNVVLGDEKGTNSIGKSSLLLVIDFVFGGSQFLNNSDVIDHVGHHEYRFYFRFNGACYNFIRSTKRPDVVRKCSERYEFLESVSLEHYTRFLNTAYGLDGKDISFRSFVGRFSRVWGKKNNQVDRPLHPVPEKSEKECVDDIIKIFNKFGTIERLDKLLRDSSEKRKALNAAVKKQILPKITKSKYKHNEKRIGVIWGELDELKRDLAKFAMNINQLVNEDMAIAVRDKDLLLEKKMVLESKLTRIKNNVSLNKYPQSKNLTTLVKFFPGINQDRLTKIEAFHSGLAKILNVELKQEEKKVREQLTEVEQELGALDSEIGKCLASVGMPEYIVDHVLRLSTELRVSESENSRYENRERLNAEIRQIKEEIQIAKSDVLAEIESKLNEKLLFLTNKLYGKSRKSPRLVFNERGYRFDVSGDTGTGKAYANLLIFDLAVFDLTGLPFVIHDSFLFKNVESEAVASLIEIYSNNDKQSFIAIDEVDRYGEEVQCKITESSVAQLSNEHVLFIRDWRSVDQNHLE